MTPNGKQLHALLAASVDGQIPWEQWEASALSTYIAEMRATPQNPAWHGEGDVWTHTKLVCEALVSDEEYRKCDTRMREIVFFAALLHDIGKIRCTVIEEGEITSPYHARTGSAMARTLLWETCGLCGTRDETSLREAVCALIRYHGMPLHAGERGDPERELIKIASIGEVAPAFTLQALSLLVRADIRGRIAPDIQALSEEASFTFLMAEELGIMTGPYPFPNEATKHAYLTGGQVARDYPLYDDTWQEVILLSGLPAAGKDTYIREHYAHVPMISLDDIREELRISPTDKEGQGVVVAEAKERARALLREKKSFVWNATDLTPTIRGSLLAMFEKYRAYTHVVYLEVPLDAALTRNASRTRVVPEDVIRHMLNKTEPPLPHEAHRVEWVTAR